MTIRYVYNGIVETANEQGTHIRKKSYPNKCTGAGGFRSHNKNAKSLNRTLENFYLGLKSTA